MPIYKNSKKVVHIYKVRLPAEYQQVEYIENDGDAYINTLFPLLGTSSAEIKFQRMTTSGSSEGSGFFGARVSGDSKQFTFILGSNQYYSWGYANDSGNTSTKWNTSTQLNKSHIAYRNKNKMYLDGTEISLGQSSSAFTSSLNALLFTYNNGGSHSVAKKYRIWYCKIWDNGVLVRNMIPCYRKSDNELGFYDIVNGVFYTKQGGGTFSAGNKCAS